MSSLCLFPKPPRNNAFIQFLKDTRIPPWNPLVPPAGCSHLSLATDLSLQTWLFSIIKRIPGTLGNCQPFLPCRPGLPFHQRANQHRGPVSGHGFVMWSGSPSGRGRCLSGSAWGRGGLQSVSTTSAVPDTRGPRVGIRDSEKSGLLAAHAITGNSRCLLQTLHMPGVKLIPLS